MHGNCLNLINFYLVGKKLIQFFLKIIADGLSWSSFIKHYRKTFKRILIMRGDHKTRFDFKTHEAVDFYRREKSKTNKLT